MPKRVRIGSLEDFPEGSAREVIVDNRVLAVYCVQGTVYVLDGLCPHQGGPLGQGRLQGFVVTCPWHGWQYDVRTGQHQSIRPLVHRTFPVTVEGSDVFVDLDT
jgi:nitrite reductase (NADH) small subunit